MKARLRIIRALVRSGSDPVGDDDGSIIEDLGITAAFQDSFAPTPASKPGGSSNLALDDLESKLAAARSIS